MTKIPTNAGPLALLDKLGIRVKPSKHGDIALPQQLGDYLDRVIQSGDLQELNTLIPGINKAVVTIGKTNPVVLLKALIASNKSAEAFFQTASVTVDPHANPNYRHLANLASYHSQQVKMLADIAAEAGLSNHGMHFEITNETKFNALLKGLSETEGFTLDEEARKLFNDISGDMTFSLSLDNPSMPELENSLGYLEQFYSLGLTELYNESTNRSINSEDVISSLRELKENYDDPVAFEQSFEHYQQLIEPLV